MDLESLNNSMFENITIELGKLSDMADLTRIQKECMSSFYRGIYPDDDIDKFDINEHRLRATRFASADNFLIIRKGNAPIGYIVIMNYAQGIYLKTVKLLPQYQNVGIATYVIWPALIRYCITSGAHELTWYCNKHNKAAQEFYSSMQGIIMPDSQFNGSVSNNTDTQNNETNNDRNKVGDQLFYKIKF